MFSDTAGERESLKAEEEELEVLAFPLFRRPREAVPVFEEEVETRVGEREEFGSMSIDVVKDVPAANGADVGVVEEDFLVFEEVLGVRVAGGDAMVTSSYTRYNCKEPSISMVPFRENEPN